jgi:hypothetical protein
MGEVLPSNWPVKREPRDDATMPFVSRPTGSGICQATGVAVSRIAVLLMKPWLNSGDGVLVELVMWVVSWTIGLNDHLLSLLTTWLVRAEANNLLFGVACPT